MAALFGRPTLAPRTDVACGDPHPLRNECLAPVLQGGVCLHRFLRGLSRFYSRGLTSRKPLPLLPTPEPETTRGAEQGTGVGEQPADHSMDVHTLPRPLVIAFFSGSAPSAVAALPQLQSLRNTYSSIVDWLWVYGAEDHADEPCYGQASPCGRPRDVEQRGRFACAAAAAFSLQPPVVLDHTSTRNGCTRGFNAGGGLVVVLDQRLRVAQAFKCVWLWWPAVARVCLCLCLTFLVGRQSHTFPVDAIRDYLQQYAEVVARADPTSDGL